jgi:glycine oxidase
VPKSDHHYVIGATEIESEDDKPTSVRSALELLSAAYSVHKGFAEATLESIQSGLRPTLDDNEPIISRDGRHIQINGLYRHGYLLAPYLLHHTLNYFKGIADDTATTKSYSDMDLLSNVSLFTSADLKRAKTFN